MVEAHQHARELEDRHRRLRLPLQYGLPDDAPTWSALFIASVLLVRSVASRVLATPRRWFVLFAAALAFVLSASYVTTYLRGGPRIIDATTYFLEARALSHGDLAWPLTEPSTATTGRFLVRDELAGGANLGGIFPPGWPAVLALGMLVGAPMSVGPVLAALLTLATAWFAEAALPRDAHAREASLRVAVLLSVFSGALRYHTADTMSHGLSSLLVLLALTAALRRRAGGGWGFAALLGGSLGLLVATRPVTALAAIVMVVLVARPRAADLPTAALSAAPALALFALHQRAVTGAWGVSSQSFYYALSDGPAGCFRYGFGDGVGCLGEHPEFVAHNLPDGYGAVEALKTTLRRLALHVQDPLNDELLGVALFVGVAAAGWRARGLRGLAMAPMVLVVAYAPFYFDGNYPGGGARFFSEVLTIEIVVGVVGLSFLAERRLRMARRPFLLVSLSLVGFAFNAHTDHEQLRDREGGRPMWQASDTRHLEGPALLFVDTDHGFGLAYDPAATASAGDVEVVRWRNDVTDLLAIEARSVPAFRHSYDVHTGLVIVSPFTPENTTHLCASSLWPPRQQRGAFARVVRDASTCGTHLELTAAEPDAEIVLDLPAELANRSLRPMLDTTATVEVDVRAPGGPKVKLRFDSPGSASITGFDLTAP